MFLRRQGYSKRYTFDVIYSALQKSLRRGDVELSVEMGYEFKDYPNALKKRLIQNCTEDCPDLLLINNIYNTPPEHKLLMPFIPVICKHIKCRDGCYAMRLACEMEPINEAPILGRKHDDLITLSRKCFSYLCNQNELTFISYFQNRHPNINLEKIYKYVGKHITFLYTLNVWETIDYIHEKYTIEKFDYEDNKIFDMNLKLPSYVYDKHVRSSEKQNRTYTFFINNIILHPRKEESQIEIEGKKLYIESNKGVGEIIKNITGVSSKKTKKGKGNEKKEMIIKFEEKHEEDEKATDEKITDEKITDEKIIDETNEEYKNMKLIQTQLITGKYKQKVYYCSLDNGENYSYILKGPYDNCEEMNQQLLSDLIKQKLLPSSSSYSSKAITIKGKNYILSNNFIPIEKDNTIIKSSKLEENAVIYNGNKYFFSHEFVNSLTKDEQIELLKILSFRKIIGTNDTCCRNIIYYNKHLFSIDDPVLLQTTNYMFKVPNNKYGTAYNKLVRQNFKEITEFLNEWDTIVRNSEDIADNIKDFISNKIIDFLIQNNWKFD